jgi:hypothetical protein
LRAIAAPSSSGSSTIRLPIGSVPPPGSGSRMLLGFTYVLGTVSVSTTRIQVRTGSAEKYAAAVWTSASLSAWAISGMIPKPFLVPLLKSAICWTI